MCKLAKSPASLAQPNQGGDHCDDPLSKSTGSLRITAEEGHVPLHTRFLPSDHPIRDRSFWILHGLKPHGTLYIDSGAHKALVGKAGLLPVGVVDLDGSFAQQEAVRICVVKRRSSIGAEASFGTVQRSKLDGHSRTTRQPRLPGSRGTRAQRSRHLLGYADSEYVAQREHISFFRKESRPVTPVREMIDGQGIGGYEVSGPVL